MKKNRFFSALLAAVLALALVVPTALAAGSGSEILDAMQVDAAAAVLIDADHGDLLFAQDAHARRYPASITKVMTALLVLEQIDGRKDGSPAPDGPAIGLSDMVTVGDQLYAGIGAGASTADIKREEQLTVKDLLASALIPSANEACNALAQYVDGDVDKFVERMNVRAQELGMEDTHFANTHGYHDDDHYTTAYDVALMCREAMKHDAFRELVALKNYTLPATNLHEERMIRTTNALISNFKINAGYLYSKCIGIKTGHTPEAGYCLASAAYDDGKTLIAVVMGAERVPGTTGSEGFTYFRESSRLLEWGFDNFTRRVVLDESASHGEIPVTLGKEQNYVSVWPVGSIEATLPRDLDLGLFELERDCVDSLEAPVQKGQKVGTLTVSLNGQVYGTLDLVAGDSVERSAFRYAMDRTAKFLDQTWVKAVLLAVILLILVILLRVKLFGGRSRRYGASRRGGYSGSRRRR